MIPFRQDWPGLEDLQASQPELPPSEIKHHLILIEDGEACADEWQRLNDVPIGEGQRSQSVMVPVKRFELPTHAVRMRCSPD